VIYGEEGQIQVGRFAQKPDEVLVDVYGRRLSAEPLARRVFAGEPDHPGNPEFLPRFRSAYMGEAAAFVDCCASGARFPVSHQDALRAQIVISAGMQRILTRAEASPVVTDF
jgi:predicted dehydrogenase